MSLDIVIYTSIGNYDCTIKEVEQGKIYDVKMKRQDCEPGKAYLIYSGSFRIRIENGVPIVNTYKKEVKRPHWYEIERLVGNEILLNI